MLLSACDVVKDRIMILLPDDQKKRKDNKETCEKTSWWEKSRSENLLRLIKSMDKLNTKEAISEHNCLLFKVKMGKYLKTDLNKTEYNMKLCRKHWDTIPSQVISKWLELAWIRM